MQMKKIEETCTVQLKDKAYDEITSAVAIITDSAKLKSDTLMDDLSNITNGTILNLDETILGSEGDLIGTILYVLF